VVWSQIKILSRVKRQPAEVEPQAEASAFKMSEDVWLSQLHFLTKRDAAHAHEHADAGYGAPPATYEEPAASYGAPARSYSEPETYRKRSFEDVSEAEDNSDNTNYDTDNIDLAGGYYNSYQEDPYATQEDPYNTANTNQSY